MLSAGQSRPLQVQGAADTCLLKKMSEPTPAADATQVYVTNYCKRGQVGERSREAVLQGVELAGWQYGG